jgi:hypothetical protein
MFHFYLNHLIILPVVFIHYLCFFLGNFVQSNDNDVSEQYSIYLSHIVHLANVNQINFEPCVFARLWEFIPFILQ